MLNTSLRNLIFNALKFSNKNVEIRITGEQKGKWIKKMDEFFATGA